MNQTNFRPLTLLRIFIGLVFLAAGLYRLFSWPAAVLEFSQISPALTYPLLFFTLALEIIGGLLLILNLKTKTVALIFILFLTFALIKILSNSGPVIVSKAQELFFLDPTPTDLFLHFTYLIILISIFLTKK